MLLSKEASSSIFWVFSMSWPGIEPWSPGPLVNSRAVMPMGWSIEFKVSFYLYRKRGWCPLLKYIPGSVCFILFFVFFKTLKTGVTRHICGISSKGETQNRRFWNAVEINVHWNSSSTKDAFGLLSWKT